LGLSLFYEPPTYLASPFFATIRYPLRLLFLLVYALLAGPAFAQVAQPVAFVSLPFDLVNGLVVVRMCGL
jgi:hypothetical protein